MLLPDVDRHIVDRLLVAVPDVDVRARVILGALSARAGAAVALIFDHEIHQRLSNLLRK